MMTMTSSTLLSFVRGTLVRAARQVRHHIACHDLHGMPDHVLKDIGIGRGGIEHAVRYGREGRAR
jgi:uncharacterized protein YjiS (DUF1127 family)